MTGYPMPRRSRSQIRFHAPVSIGIMLTLLCMTAVEATCEPHHDLLQQFDSLFGARQYDSALCVAAAARDSASATFGEEDTSVATALFCMGMAHYCIADNQGAEDCWSRSLVIREQLLGDNHRQVGRAMNALGVIKMYKGEYPRAEDLFKRALGIAEGSVGMHHPDALKALDNLATVSMWLGKYDQAASFYSQVVEVLDTASESGDLQLYTALSGLALINKQRDDHEAAVFYAERALRMGEELFGQNSTRLGMNLLNLGDQYFNQGRLREAEQTLRRYIAIQEASGDNNSQKTTVARMRLARIYYAQGDSAAFREAYSGARQGLEQIFDGKRQSLARDLHLFSRYFRSYDRATSLKYALRSFEIRRQNLLDNYGHMSEQEALVYAAFLRSAAANYLACHFESGSEHASDPKAAEIVFTCKGQVSEEMFERHRYLNLEVNSQVADLRDSLKRVKEGLAETYSSMPSDMPWSQYWIELDSLRAEKQQLESRIAEQTTVLRDQHPTLAITPERLLSHLPDNSVLVEYMKFHHWQPDLDTNIIHYLAAVLESDTGNLTVRDLGSADRIDSAVSAYRQHMLDVSRNGYEETEPLRDYREVASRLHTAVWQPIEEQIADGQLMFVAPDGALNLVSFAALPDNTGRYLIERNAIHYLSSGRDILRLEQSGKQGEGLLVMGDPDYDASVQDRALAKAETARSWGKRDQLIPNASGSRDTEALWDTLGEVTVDRLPGTRGEVDQVVKLWRQAFEDTVFCFLDASATEDNLKEFARGRRAIHLATHGYYIPSGTQQCLSADGPTAAPGVVVENPLLSSGLFLAGSNLRGQLADGLNLDDGILTAEEVSCIDLTGVEWVVLSACESGLGEIESGEGVYGLRRAFQISGARTVISSLWPVGDRSTAEFMSSLYAAADQPLFSVVRQYQLDLINKLRHHGYSDHPHQWAAFISTGDWR